MIIVAGALYVQSSQRDDYLAGCRQVIVQARASPGCFDFVLAADPLEPERINVYERWQSDEHLDRFRAAGPQPVQAELIRTADVAKYYVQTVEET